MTFHIPSMTDLLTAAKKLDQTYTKIRALKDENRWFSSWRPATHNPERIHDIQFIKNLAQYLSDNKHNYEKMDPKLKGKNYAWEIAPFLKEALCGSMLLDLSKITLSYSGDEKSTKKNSSLAQVILEVFTIDGLSEVPVNKWIRCLESLKQCIKVLDTYNLEHDKDKIQWHPKKNNETILGEIDQELKLINNKMESTKTFAI